MLHEAAKGLVRSSVFSKNFNVSFAAASYHLRKLAGYRFIKRVEGKGNEKPFEITQLGRMALVFFLKFREAHPESLPGDPAPNEL